MSSSIADEHGRSSRPYFDSAGQKYSCVSRRKIPHGDIEILRLAPTTRQTNPMEDTMHVLEAALFANLVSKERLPEAWRPVPDRPQQPIRPFRATALRVLTKAIAYGSYPHP